MSPNVTPSPLITPAVIAIATENVTNESDIKNEMPVNSAILPPRELAKMATPVKASKKPVNIPRPIRAPFMSTLGTDHSPIFISFELYSEETIANAKENATNERVMDAIKH